MKKIGTLIWKFAYMIHPYKPLDQRAIVFLVYIRFHNSYKPPDFATNLLRVDLIQWHVDWPSILYPHFGSMTPICLPTAYSMFVANSMLSAKDFDPIPVTENLGKAMNHK